MLRVPPLFDLAPSAGPVGRARTQGTGEPLPSLPCRRYPPFPPSDPAFSLHPILPTLPMPSYSTRSHGSKEFVESLDTQAPAGMREPQEYRATPGFPAPED